MQGWLSKDLGDGMMAHEALGRIEARFAELYSKAGKPNDMAVFIRHDSEGRLHCRVLVYFSPAAGQVAEEAGARSCRKPSPCGLGLLAGSERSWPALFPEKSNGA